MPFKSRAQRAYLHIHHPEVARKWEAHTPKDKKLPQHVKKSELLKIALGVSGAGIQTSPLSSSVWTNLGKPIARPVTPITPGTRSPTSFPLSGLDSQAFAGLLGKFRGSAIPTLTGTAGKIAADTIVQQLAVQAAANAVKSAELDPRLVAALGIPAVAAAVSGPVGAVSGFAGAPRGYGLEGAGRGWRVGTGTGIGAGLGGLGGAAAGHALGGAAGDSTLAKVLGILGAAGWGLGGGYLGYRLSRGAAGAPYWTRDELLEQRRRIDES